MAEGFEPYHVPQQSRRDKLRVVAQNHPHDLQALLPLYDPSSLLSSSDLLSCKDNNSACVVKEEANSNLMAFAAASSSAPTNYHPYLDPQSSNLPLNPSTSIHDINGNFFLYTPHNLQNLKAFESSYNGGGAETEVVPFKPEPLSLSLSSQSNLPLELNLQRFGSTVTATGGYAVSGQNGVSRSAVPLGPFTGYASILKGSRFLKPAQQLLEEFCDVGWAIYSEKITMDASFFDPSTDCFNTDDPLNSAGDGSETRRNKSRLISMLDEVYRRYKYYYQQMQAVVASFECVAGLGNAAPYANLALKTMSKHFKSLKNAITDQLQFTNKGHGQLSHGKEEATRFGNYDKSLYVQRSVQNSGFIDHQPVWRPQRGLPERAVTVLKAWLFEHFLHPYPTDTDKLMLAKQTGLSRSQVSNWFINARVRLWKPMVEEIHMLETRQAQKSSQRQEHNVNKSSNLLPASNSLVSENPSTSTQRVPDIPSKHTRNDLPDLPSGNEEPLNLSYNGLSMHPPIGVSMSKAGGSNSVSLTLGLHQNNGMGVSEPFPMHAAQQFGLGIETSDGLVMGGFEAQNRHFGRDVIEGQLLHDFVG